jgi:hypothetical protein
LKSSLDIEKLPWTDLKDLRRQVEKYWDRGLLLAAYIDDQAFFPKRLVFKTPSSKQLSEHFSEVKQWIGDLKSTEHIRIETKSVQHRVLGQNELPITAWVDDLDSAVAIIGKQKQLQQFVDMVEITNQRAVDLLPWLRQFSMKALSFTSEWNQIIDTLDWMKANPNPDIYLRQVDISGIDSKFIELHKGIITTLLEITMPTAGPTTNQPFESRYGFKTKPVTIRIRSLDPDINFMGSGNQDISVTLDNLDTFSNLSQFNAVKNLFITENETNFLSFPPTKNSIVVFGSGYGFDGLDKIAWLNRLKVYYWGDIDTHGFAILNQLRSKLPEVRSLLMNRKTFLKYETFWGFEPKPQINDLDHLNDEEIKIYNDLRDNRFGHQLRLEQERIGFTYLMSVLSAV